ncbi:hypothetical protein JIN85_15905 [Luteolibacter pohnpeiensis]|uniref:Uncharacterized protein n=1 Tax=Luteolibacter pohnpeiensis TaxID=454153 RepID=A0A934S8S5_9BACT|nr:hypothetical protein [Luteolibacter pohnpeiensis]MBK1883903.1 hypothetical protein [Luteolibacter pohnpeiensis]
MLSGFHPPDSLVSLGGMRNIDQWLACEELDEPFTHCIDCKLPLLEISEPWLVNKEYFRDECILEYAICKKCRDRTTDQLSEESKEVVRQFLEQEIDWAKRMKEFMMQHDPAQRFQACIACRKKQEDCTGFSISALFDSEGHLQNGPLPLLVCSDCIGSITGRLSEHSKGVWRRFLDGHFEGPPSDASVPGFF